ncbi:MAG: tRNA-dihydrouridine synthase, partial [Candidatus Saccharimonadales bacterium]
KYHLDGIMIGRGIFHDPFVFAEQSPWPECTKEQRVGLYKKHVQLFADTWQHSERHIATLNKFCKVYISDFDGAKELREELMQAQSAEELLAMLAKV